MSDGALQVAPAQQPLGQLVALQPLQCPAVQVWPAGQLVQALPPPPHERGAVAGEAGARRAAPGGARRAVADAGAGDAALPGRAGRRRVPQRQTPVAEQLSDRASQATQLDPAMPQLAIERVEQIAPLQQPPGHDVPSQTHSPLVAALAARARRASGRTRRSRRRRSDRPWPESQALQAAPLAPQLPSDGAVQTLPLQHPFGHDVASQAHAPPTQRWPLPHGGPLPHAHAPAIEQVSAFVASQATARGGAGPARAQRARIAGRARAAAAGAVVRVAVVAGAVAASAGRARLASEPARAARGVGVAGHADVAAAAAAGAAGAVAGAGAGHAVLAREAGRARAARAGAVGGAAVAGHADRTSRQAAPLVPQAAALGVVQTPVAQHPLGQVVALHASAPSRRQVDEQPSPDVVLPSSHSSMPERTTPSPQIAGSPSVSVTLTSWPSCTATACWSLPTTLSPAQPVDAQEHGHPRQVVGQQHHRRLLPAGQRPRRIGERAGRERHLVADRAGDLQRREVQPGIIVDGDVDAGRVGLDQRGMAAAARARPDDAAASASASSRDLEQRIRMALSAESSVPTLPVGATSRGSPVA